MEFKRPQSRKYDNKSVKYFQNIFKHKAILLRGYTLTLKALPLSQTLRNILRASSQAILLKISFHCFKHTHTHTHTKMALPSLPASFPPSCGQKRGQKWRPHSSLSHAGLGVQWVMLRLWNNNASSPLLAARGLRQPTGRGKPALARPTKLRNSSAAGN